MRFFKKLTLAFALSIFFVGSASAQTKYTACEGPPGRDGRDGQDGKPGPPGPVVTMPVPTPRAQAARRHPLTRTATKSSNNGVIFDASVGYLYAPIRTEYSYSNPSSGDVPQKHNFAAPIISARFDQSRHSGVYASAMTTFLGLDTEQVYQDLQGNWLGKKRDSDTSRDKMLSVNAGYKFPVGDIVSVGAGMGFDYTCLCEKYFAQNTDSQTERSFKTLGVAVEASGSSNNGRLTVHAGGTFGLWGQRNKWTQQVYQGPPVINFPKVTDAQQDAKLNRVSGEVEIRVAGPVHVFANVGWSRWNSNRPGPASNPATENTSATTFVAGIRIGK